MTIKHNTVKTKKVQVYISHNSNYYYFILCQQMGLYLQIYMYIRVHVPSISARMLVTETVERGNR